MANGFQWFRYWHGTADDQKFRLVSKRCGRPIAEVFLVWMVVLDKASQAEERGMVKGIDHDLIDCAYSLEEGTSAIIFAEFLKAGMVVENHIVNWSKRQPKREDETATQRQRKLREKKRDVTQCHAPSRNVTKGHAPETDSETDKEKRNTPQKPPFCVPQTESQPDAPQIDARPDKPHYPSGMSQSASDAILERNSAIPADFDLTPEGLAGLWQFSKKGTRNKFDDTRHLLDVFGETIRTGIAPEAIREAILDPKRDRTEAVFRLQERLRPKGQTGGNRPKSHTVDQATLQEAIDELYPKKAAR